MRRYIAFALAVFINITSINCAFSAHVGRMTDYNPVPQDAPKCICLESVEFYADSTFKEVAGKNDLLIQIGREKVAKYMWRIREAMNEEFAQHDLKVIACSKHSSDDEGDNDEEKNSDERGKEEREHVQDDVKVLHMRVKAAYKRFGFLGVKIFLRFEMYDGDTHLFDVDAETEGSVAGDRREQKEKLKELGKYITKKIAEKIKGEGKKDGDEKR